MRVAIPLEVQLHLVSITHRASSLFQRCEKVGNFANSSSQLAQESLSCAISSHRFPKLGLRMRLVHLPTVWLACPAHVPQSTAPSVEIFESICRRCVSRYAMCPGQRHLRRDVAVHSIPRPNSPYICDFDLNLRQNPLIYLFTVCLHRHVN